MPDIERPAWRGGGLIVVKGVEIPPLEYGYAKVLISSDNVPGTRKVDFVGVEESARSRNAQMHFAFQEGAALKIGEQVDAQGIAEGELNYGFEVQAPVRNYAPRPMQIDAGIELGRLYVPGRQIKGERLGDLISSKDIHIDGVEGKDWWRMYKGYPKNKTTLVGVTTRVHPGRSGIPPYSRGGKKLPIQLSSVQGKGEYRGKVDAHLATLLDVRGKVLGIAETSVDLAMIKGIDAIIEKGVYSSVASRSPKDLVGEHIPARLLDGGKELWRIRLELWGELVRGLVDNFVDMIFVDGPKTSNKTP